MIGSANTRTALEHPMTEYDSGERDYLLLKISLADERIAQLTAEVDEWRTEAATVIAALDQLRAVMKKEEGRVVDQPETHWIDCWRVHHSCAVAQAERVGARLKRIHDLVQLELGGDGDESSE